ncbi:hypothetical protein IQ266_01555 [filamentous cyanobacterium LEGE 11480]|uniref:Uncharacterized protein n=1 Tax=Romeriopsis navalis LEGE 11480 TaxID=2777977 RepID=A0A928VHI5_9CYAN|nr:hypothetical protein [Romeriopsis navalis]MBE9028440.1 hypothetical protein [Romeriopsis navalis LEGE 11480]
MNLSSPIVVDPFDAMELDSAMAAPAASSNLALPNATLDEVTTQPMFQN